MAKRKKLGPKDDPWPYDGPIERVDGQRPFNHHLWPTESWWAGQDLGHHIDARWHFGIIALADGRFSIEGAVWAIEENEYNGKPCVFATRTKAIRVAAARMIETARASRTWKGYNTGRLEGIRLAEVVNWAREIVARETGRPAPKPVHVKHPPPIRQPTGLPLFDFC